MLAFTLSANLHRSGLPELDNATLESFCFSAYKCHSLLRCLHVHQERLDRYRPYNPSVLVDYNCKTAWRALGVFSFFFSSFLFIKLKMPESELSVKTESSENCSPPPLLLESELHSTLSQRCCQNVFSCIPLVCRVFHQKVSRYIC